jgi:MFS family permease
MVALVLVAAGLGLLALATGAVVIIVGAVVLAVGVAFITPAVFAAIFQAVPPAERGAASGTASVFIDLGFGLGPMLVGVVAAQADIPAGFAATTAIALAAVALLAASSRAGARAP